MATDLGGDAVKLILAPLALLFCFPESHVVNMLNVCSALLGTVDVTIRARISVNNLNDRKEDAPITLATFRAELTASRAAMRRLRSVLGNEAEDGRQRHWLDNSDPESLLNTCDLLQRTIDSGIRCIEQDYTKDGMKYKLKLLEQEHKINELLSRLSRLITLVDIAVRPHDCQVSAMQKQRYIH